MNEFNYKTGKYSKKLFHGEDGAKSAERYFPGDIQK